MIVVTKDGVQHKMNINYLDYMLGFTRESQLKKLLKEVRDISPSPSSSRSFDRHAWRSCQYPVSIRRAAHTH